MRYVSWDIEEQCIDGLYPQKIYTIQATWVRLLNEKYGTMMDDFAINNRSQLFWGVRVFSCPAPLLQ